jgi:2,4-dienoyl-CoA reductase-like NADH-dependent reductase (Old Yellow Enzyme family)/thioredoxin reductase
VIAETTPAFAPLFSEFALGGVRLKNRIVSLAHGTALVERGVPTEDDLAYWEARAAGGGGLVIVGGTGVHPSGLLRDRRRSEAWNPAALEQMARRAEAVHRHGAAIFCQLGHLGRESVGGASVHAPVGPSAIRSPRDSATPHPLTDSEIDELVEAFVAAAENVRHGGYDGVELHAGHGYLIAQFLSPAANRRDDAYGGDLAGRMRFLDRILAGIRERSGRDFVVGVRLSADEEVAGGLRLADTLEIARRLTDADYLNITLGQRGAYVKDITHPEGVAVESAAAVKAVTPLPVVVAGRITRPELAQSILERGAADLVGMARAFVVDPEWPKKAAAGSVRSIRPCIGVNQECRTFPGGILCAASARTGRERWFAEALGAPMRTGLRVAVAGGGPAGLEAAGLAAELGAEVVLFERERQLGGQLRLAAAVESRAGVLALADHLEHEARRVGVDIRLGQEATPDVCAADAVVVATGAVAVPPPYVRDPGARVLSVWALLAGEEPPDGERAVVVDDGTGFWEAVSAAELLGDRGYRVALVTPARSVGAAIPFESTAPLLRRLGARSVAFHSLARPIHVGASTVWLEDALTGEQSEIPADFVVGHAGAVSDDALVAAMERTDVAVRAIGDCLSPRRLTQAIWDADRTVLELMRADTDLRPAPRAW